MLKKLTYNHTNSYKKKFEKLSETLDINTVYHLMSLKFDKSYLAIPKFVDEKYTRILKKHGLDVDLLERNWIVICSDTKNPKDDLCVFVKNNDDETILINLKPNFSISAAHLKLAANSDYNDVQKYGAVTRDNSILMHGLQAGKSTGKRDKHGWLPIAKLSEFYEQISPTHMFLDKIENIFAICERHPRVVTF